MTVTTIEYALLAANVYGNSSAVRTDRNTLPCADGWTRLPNTPAEVTQAGSTGTGFMASAYQKGNDIVVCFAGTGNDAVEGGEGNHVIEGMDCADVRGGGAAADSTNGDGVHTGYLSSTAADRHGCDVINGGRRVHLRRHCFSGAFRRGHKWVQRRSIPRRLGCSKREGPSGSAIGSRF